MNVIQEKLLKMLTTFNGVCRKNKIEYFLGGQTALGAVRDGGFLTASDTVTLFFRRDEWERALPILEEHLPSEYKIVVSVKYHSYREIIAKIVDVSTSSYLPYNISDGTPKGLSLNIVLLFPRPTEKNKQIAHYSDYWLYMELFSEKVCYAGYNWDLKYLPYRKYKEVEDYPFDLCNDIYDSVFACSESDAQEYVLGVPDKYYVFPKSAFEYPEYFDFENLSLPVPKGYVDIFHQLYGDWWMIKSNDDKIALVNEEVNIDVSSREFENVLGKCISPVYNSKSVDDKKRSAVDKAFYENQLMRARLSLQESLLREKITEEQIAECKTFIGKGEYDKIFESMEEYYALQEEGFKYRTYIRVNPKLVLYCAIAKIMTGDFEYADKLRKIVCSSADYARLLCEKAVERESHRIQNGGEGPSVELNLPIKDIFVDKRLTKLFEDVVLMRRTLQSYYADDYQDYFEGACDLLRQYPGQLDILEFAYACKVEDRFSDTETLIGELQYLTKKYPDRYVFKKALGDAYHKVRRRPEAISCYHEVIKGTDNLLLKKYTQENLDTLLK